MLDQQQSLANNSITMDTSQHHLNTFHQNPLQTEPSLGVGSLTLSSVRKNVHRNMGTGKFMSEKKVTMYLSPTATKDSSVELSKIRAIPQGGGENIGRSPMYSSQAKQQMLKKHDFYTQLHHKQSHNNSLVHQVSTYSSNFGGENTISRLHKLKQSERNSQSSNNPYNTHQNSTYQHQQMLAQNSYADDMMTAETALDHPHLNNSLLHEQSTGLVSYKHFKNTSGVGLATLSARKSLNEITHQMKKSKEIHELMLERKNIENMIVNSKLWSPQNINHNTTNHMSIMQRGNLQSTNTMFSMSENEAAAISGGACTNNVFKDKREELTKILKKRLNYIHQQSSQNQHILSSMNSGTNLKNTTYRGSAMQPLSSSPQITGLGRKGFKPGQTGVVSPKTGQFNLTINKKQTVNQQQSFDNVEDPSKFPIIQQQQSKQWAAPGKGGNPFMIKANDSVSPPKRDNQPYKQKNKQQSILPQNITQQNNDSLQMHVDAVISDDSFKRGMQEQLSVSIQSKGEFKTAFAQDTFESASKETHITNNTSLQRQMVFQNDFQVKVGQINKRMDEEFGSLDMAMEHLKLKKPHQLGLTFSVMPLTSSPLSNPFNKVKETKSKAPMRKETIRKDYISVIKSPHHLADMAGELQGEFHDQDNLTQIDMQEQMQMEQIRNFALQLMRQRKILNGTGTEFMLQRQDSFNTSMGMAYSTKYDADDANVTKDEHFRESHHSHHEEEEEDESPTTHHHDVVKIQRQTQESFVNVVLETERGIKAQEMDFLKKVNGTMIKEFQITGTAAAANGQSPRQSVNSLYRLKKKKSLKKSSLEDIPPYVEAYMKNMKTQTLELLTQDVKARNSFFQFVKHHPNAVFVEKFLTEPKLNYLMQCNKEFVTALPTVSKIQGKTLNLLGYRLNEGVCKAIRIYLENFKNALTKIALDNNGMNSGEVLTELLHGVQAQEDFKQIVIVRNTVDDGSTNIIIEMLHRQFPRCLEELRIVNCKISPVSTFKILSKIDDGTSTLKKLSLSGAQINEQSLELLSSIVTHVRSLIDLDISWNGLRPNANLKKFMEALGTNRSIQYLNMSWNNLMMPQAIIKEDQHKPNNPQGTSGLGDQKTDQPSHNQQEQNEGGGSKKKKEEHKLDDYTQHLLDNLLRFIKYNKHLIHLDLSYTRLDEMMIIALGTSLRRAKSLVAVHFTGNPGVTQKAAEYLQGRVHCRGHRDRHTKKENMFALQTMSITSPRQQKAFDGVQIKQILQKQKIVMNTTGGQSYKPEIDEGKQLQFQRWLGHKFEIPGSGQWQMNSAWEDFKDQCWVCNKWSYTVIYWSPSVQMSVTKSNKSNPFDEDFEEIEIIKPLLRQSVPLSGKVPVLAGSFTDWQVREMIPMIDFCITMDPNRPDPIQILKKQGRVRDEVECEADIKTDKEKHHLERVKEQIKQDYKLKWKALLMKGLRYKRACHVNLEFAQEIDLRYEELHVFAAFGTPGQHLYYVQDPATSQEYVNKCIIPVREDELPIFEKANKSKVQHRVFKKEHSVFKEWKEDTPSMLTSMFQDDIKWWKIARFIKDENDRERSEKVLEKNFRQIKKIFTSFISQSMFPNISWIDFGNFCEKCKIIDGKGVNLTTVDRAFIAANVALDGQKISEDNPTNALSRFEFLEILLRLAQSKYKETNVCATYEESIMKLLEEHIIPLSNPEPWQEFRDDLLWTIDVNDVLEVNLEGLKKVYKNYHEPRKNYMTMQDALNLMMRDTSLGFIEKDAIYCYGMSKMSVIYEQDNMWQYKQLKMVELLEMIGRMAHQKFKDHPELHESLSLAQKIEHVLDVVLKLVDVTRKDVVNNVVEESESDDDY